MSRNDGRPRSVVALSLDPLPWVHKLSQKRHKGDQDCWVYCEFLPRPGFIQDKEAYS